MTRMIENPASCVSDEVATHLWALRSSTESFLEVLRKEGSSKIESIRLLRNVAGISLGEAKVQVHESEAWRDRRAHDNAFHESAWQALELLQEESKAAVA